MSGRRRHGGSPIGRQLIVSCDMSLRVSRMTAAEIAETLSMPLSTVSALLQRSGIGRLGRIGLEQPVRYEHLRPGEPVHIDVKKLGRIDGGRRQTGWRPHARPPPATPPRRKPTATAARSAGESVHVAVDDHSRLAYAEALPDEKAIAIAYL